MCLACGALVNFAKNFNPLVAESFVTCTVIDRTLDANLKRCVFHPDVMRLPELHFIYHPGPGADDLSLDLSYTGPEFGLAYRF